MQTLLMKILQSDIPKLSEGDCADLLWVMTGHPEQRPFSELASLLIETGIQLGDLLLVMLSCEKLIVHQLMVSADSETEKNLTKLSSCVDNFRQIKRAAIEVAVRKGHQSPVVEISESTMSACRNAWLAEGVVQLHNYYYEMPVMANATCLGVDGIHVEVAMSAEVVRSFAAGEDMREVIATTPDGQQAIRLGALACDGERIKLVVRSVNPVERERRHDVRIRSEKEIKVHLMRHGMMVEANLRDISVNGMGFEISGSTDMQLGESVGCVWHLEGTKIYLESMLCWVRVQNGITRTGVSFKSPGPFGDAIHAFIRAEQHVLINRLRNLSAPAWIRDKLSKA